MAIVRTTRRKRRRSGRTNKGKTKLPTPEAGRAYKANVLKNATMCFFLSRGYSCYTELGVLPWGSRRADVLCSNLKGTVAICEVKSSVQDYATDSKWREYLPHCNRFYFVFSEKTYTKLKARLALDLKNTGAGVLVLSEGSGLLHVRKTCVQRDMDDETKLSILARAAWRGGVSKRQYISTRHFI